LKETITFKLASFLKRELPAGFVVSAEPDHPHLFAMPDIIIGGHGLLVGVYIPKKSEVRYPDDLLARLTACRLGLPNHTRNILLLPHHTHGLDIGTLSNFHEVLDLENHNTLLKFIQNPDAVGNIGPVPPKIREQAHRRYQLLYQITNLRKRTRFETKNIKELFGSLKENLKRPAPLEIYDTIEEQPAHGRKVGPRDLVEYEGSLVGLPSFRKGRSPTSSISSYCIFALRSEYTLDMGVPYPKFLGSNILLVEIMPREKYDENKSVRAAAFAGWVMAAADSPDEIPALADRLHTAWEKRRK